MPGRILGSKMMWGNWTSVSEFVLVSFSGLSFELQALLFLLFLTIYIVTLMGNILIILVTTADSALQSPMYFFLRNLSFLEIGFNLVIVPKMLGTLIIQDTTISFLGCATQMYFFFFFGAAECCLLATMAYDRYVAICDPLRYPVIMGHRACAQLAAASWFSGFPVATVQTTWIFSFPFCGPNRVNHFFCDSPPVIALVCADTSLFELEALTATVLFILFPFLLILGSYVRILSTIFRMPSAEGKRKAFSTCSSHLLVVSLFYSTAILTYFRPRSSTSPENKKLLSLSYMVVTPMLNPIIYSIRNSEVKAAPNGSSKGPYACGDKTDLDENRKGGIQGQRKEKQIPQMDLGTPVFLVAAVHSLGFLTFYWDHFLKKKKKNKKQKPISDETKYIIQ